MKELIDKLSSYNVFNYLLPGILFAALATKFTSYKLLQSDIVVGVFIYYFIGMVVSRFGSLVLQPLLEKWSFIKFAPYKDFVVASQADSKIDILSEQNNMYRTLCSLFFLLGVLKAIELIGNTVSMPEWMLFFLFTATLFLVFLFAYRKQTEYVATRVSYAKDKAPEDKGDASGAST
jgi:disulfide bond formation protein DsbB